MKLKRFKPSGGGELPAPPVSQGVDLKEKAPKKRRRSWKEPVLITLGSLLVVGLIVVATLTVAGVIDLGAVSRKVTFSVGRVFERREAVGVSDYWAVFLTSNQVYFGKLSNRDAQYLTLQDVFYLRAQRRLQPPEDDDETVIGSNTDRQQVQLIKLGDELHGPVDEIQFNRDNILFLEKLKNDSRVVRGIEQFKAGQ